MPLITLFEEVAALVLNKSVSQVKFKKCSGPDPMNGTAAYKSGTAIPILSTF